jgi:2-amino-4-hydroxy-6-hydroxymethyldihydropteridine diphosphokinase
MNDTVVARHQLAYVGLGGNQGDVMGNFEAACAAFQALPQSRLIGLSAFYRTEPIDADGDHFINAVAALDTQLDPYSLLQGLHDIEHHLGRRRRADDPPNRAARPIDLDLLMLDELVMQSAPLTLPHPRLHQRAFVLRPLLDLNPDLTIPALGTVRHFLDLVADQNIDLLATPVWAMALSGIQTDTLI